MKELKKYFKNYFSKIFIFFILVLFALFLSADTNEYYTFFKLDNGLEVYMVKRTKVPLATLYLAFRAGSFRETKDYDGLTHLFEHMFFKANKNMKTAVDYYETLNRTGIEYNGYTSQEGVVYHFTFPKDNLEDAAKIMFDSIVHTALDPIELEKEREVVLEEYARVYSNRVSYLYQYLMYKEIFGEHLSRKSVIGNYDIIKTATVEKMKYIKDTFFIPNNAALFIVGDIDLEKTEKFIRELFSKWPKGKDLSDEDFVIKDLPKDRFVFYHRFDKENINIYVLRSGPSLRDERTRDISNFAGDLYHYAMSMKGSKFYNAIKRYTDSFSFYLSWKNYYGDIEFYTNKVKAEDIKAFYKTFRTELNKSSENGYITKEEFEKAKDYYIKQSSVSYKYEGKTINTIADFLSRYWNKNWLDLVLFGKEKEYYEKVTYEDLLNYAKNYIVNKAFVFGILIDDKIREENNLDELNN